MMMRPAPYNAIPAPVAEPGAASLLVHSARETCRELIALLMEENVSVQKHKVDVIEARLQNKRRLTLRMEQLLVEIKKNSEALKADPLARNELVTLAQEVQHLQEVSRTNAAVLKAAHQLRADLVLTIRDAVDATQPRAVMYGASGYIINTDANTRLVARTV